MKNFFYLIAMSILFLMGIQWVDYTSQAPAEKEVMSVLQEDVSVETIGSLSSLFPDEQTTYVDAESLAGQLRGVGRGQRQFSVSYSLLSKALSRRLARYHLDALFQSTKHVYTSLPRLCWEFSSEHYIFGMRRILI